MKRQQGDKQICFLELSSGQLQHNLVDNDGRVNVGDAFSHIFQVRFRQSRCISYRILGAAEAV